jgi:hypothetical protein
VLRQSSGGKLVGKQRGALSQTPRPLRPPADRGLYLTVGNMSLTAANKSDRLKITQ